MVRSKLRFGHWLLIVTETHKGAMSIRTKWPRNAMSASFAADNSPNYRCTANNSPFTLFANNSPPFVVRLFEVRVFASSSA